MTNPRKYRKAFILPFLVTQQSMTFANNTLTYTQAGVQKTIDLTPYFNVEEDDFNLQDFRAKKIISVFHDLYVGDLAFLSMSIGMNNSSGAHCVLCKRKAREFNVDQLSPEDIRTKVSLTQCLNVHNHKRRTGDLVQSEITKGSIPLVFWTLIHNALSCQSFTHPWDWWIKSLKHLRSGRL